MSSNPVARLGSQGLTVSRLGFGCMSLTPFLPKFATDKDLTEEQAIAVLHKAYDLGVRLFNTSDLYGPHINERIVGKALAHVRDEVVIATKWGPEFVPGKGIVPDFSRQKCREACEGSLKRLGVSSIGLWTMRGPTIPEVPIEDTMQEVKLLVAEGKVKYVGLSEVSPDEIRRAHAVTPITAIELEWSLFTRDAEVDIVPMCRELGIGFLTYSPLGRGMLTGAFNKDALDKNGMLATMVPRFADGAVDKNLLLAGNVERLAAKKGCSTGQIALAWLLHKGPDVFPIPGTKNVKYLEDNMGALSVSLTEAEIHELEAAVPADQVVGDRYNDMAHLTYHSKSHK